MLVAWPGEGPGPGPWEKAVLGDPGVLGQSGAWHWLLWGHLGALDCCPLLFTGGKWSFLCLRCGVWTLWKRWASEEGCVLEATSQEREGQGTGELRMTVPTVTLATLTLRPCGGQICCGQEGWGGESWEGDLGWRGAWWGRTGWGFAGASLLPSAPSSM